MRNRIEVIESPFAGPDRQTLDRNASYLDECLKDSLGRGRHPFASHAYLPRVLNDGVPGERRRGLEAGRELSHVLLRDDGARWVFCVDFGMSPGMTETLVELCEDYGDRIVFRSVALDCEMTAQELVDTLASAIKHMGFTSTDDAARELAKRARDTVHEKHERNQKEQELYFAQFVKE